MWRIAVLAVAVALNVTDKPTSLKADLVFLTRDGCVNTPDLIQEAMTREQWEGWLDTRVPALGNKTPRLAARTAGGRERLEALLVQFDRDAADGLSDGAAHLSAIRAALGLTKPSR
jgi:hypothetical protein